MGRYFLELDPDGFYYTAEPGAHFEWSAVKLLESIRARWKAANPTGSTPSDNFYSLPGSPWLMCRPRQTDPLWYRDARLDNHVLKSGDHWVWSPEITASVRETDPSKHPGGEAYPKNLWQTIPTIPDDAESLLAPDWTAIEAAAGFDLPADIRVVGVAGAAPTGTSFQNLTPFVQVRTQPAPKDFFAFGFGQYLLLFTGSGITLLKSENVDGTECRKLGFWSYAAPAGGSFTGAYTFEQFVRSILVVEVPPGHLGLVFGGGNEAQVAEAYPTEPPDLRGIITNERAWWVAGAVGTSLTFQVQVVGFEDADTSVFTTSGADFDLGASYRPQIEPSLDALTALHQVAPGDVEVVKTTNSYTADNILTGEQVILSLLDETGTAWSSDGTHHGGRWRLQLGASVAGYLTPYIRDIALKFPVRLVPRLNTPLLLDDTQFASFDADASILEPDGKRVSINLWDAGARLLKDAGFDEREGYPFIIWEDTTGNDVPDTVRVTGWIYDPKITEFVAENVYREQVRLYQLKAKGLLSRLDSEWTILPQMVDPAGGGYVEHTYAVQETLLAGGFDITDPAQYAQATDTQSGTARARLPGTFANRPYAMQLNPKNEYAPSFDESKLQYATRIATRWAGWVLYETLAGQIRYHPNLPFELSLGGVNYYRSLQVWNNSADALAASMPRQRYESGAEQSVRQVVANSVRIEPPEPEEGKEPLFNPVIANDDLGWTDPTYWNFVGEPRPKTFAFREADTQEAAHNMAVVLLLTLGQRGVDWPLEVPLAPWVMVVADACEVGYVAEVQGLGDRLITHMQVQLLTSRPGEASELRTRMTVTKLPALATAALTGTIPYPGRMNPVV